MDLRFVLSSPGAAAADVVVTAPPGATVADLLGALASGTATGRVLVAGRLLPPEHPLGVPPLLDGATISWPAPTVDEPGAALGDAPLGPAGDAPTRWQLRVVAGVDAGRVVPLPAGRRWLGRAGTGRGAASGCGLTDPDVSRRHLALEVGALDVAVADAGSTNGTWLDGARVGAAAQRATDGSRIQVGSSTLLLRRTPRARPLEPDGRGGLRLRRAPQLSRREVEPTVVDLPDEPAAPSPRRLPVLPLVLPLVLSGVLAIVTSSPTMLLFGLMSPLLLLGGWLTERRGSRRELRAAWQAYRRDVAAAEAAIDDAVSREVIARRAEHPDPASILAAALARSERLWSRPGAGRAGIEVRVGTGERPTRAVVRRDGRTEPAAAAITVPIRAPLGSLPLLGICGPRHRVLASARSLIGQLTVGHGPDSLAIRVLVEDPGDRSAWEWVGRLPHARRRGAASLPAIWVAPVSIPDSELLPPPGGSVLLVVDAGPAMPRSPLGGLDAAVDPAGSIHVLCLVGSLDDVPPAAQAVLQLGPDAAPGSPPSDLLHGPQVPDAGRVAADGVGQAWAEQLADALAPLRAAAPRSAGGELPPSVSLLEVAAPGGDVAAALDAGWRRRAASMVARLGATGGGAFLVDLEVDGPHALVGGTTGSGKSELLQTLIASLALGNPPDLLGFVLIDYKGGSAFARCAGLPHTLGVVTDLDAHLMRRALASLSAELRRREHCLLDAGAPDLPEYQRRRDPSDPRQPPLPRLVLVIDEFRMLAEELPDFVHGLVRIAAVGRSLGVHLVVATQRPAGVVSADIRANVSLRIALRVRDALDSTDVIEVPDAARIPTSIPGRAYLVGAMTGLTPFQTAQASAPHRLGGSGVTVRSLAEALASDGAGAAAAGARPASSQLAGAEVRGAEPGGPATDLDVVVAATRAAARARSLPAVAPPWLPPLPRLVVAEATPDASESIRIGMRDEPQEQAQPPLRWDLARDGHLGIAGGPGTGRTTALRTVAGQLARRFDATQLHLYAVHDGALTALDQLPHCGAAVPIQQVGRVHRLLTRLHAVLAERAGSLGAAGYASVAEQRRACSSGSIAAGRGHDVPAPWTVLLLDGWEPLADALGACDHGQPLELLLALLRDGGAAGLRVVVTGERAVLTGRLAALLGRRLALRPRDPLDLVLAGLPASAVLPDQRPGRALDLSDECEVQLATLGADVSSQGQAAVLATLATDLRRAAVGGDQAGGRDSLPVRVVALPSRVRLADVEHRGGRPGSGRGPGSGHRLLVGIGGDDARPVGVTPAPGGRRWLVYGPPGSGRSSAIHTLAGQLARHGTPTVVVSGSPQGGAASTSVPAPDPPGDPGTPLAIGPDDVDDLVRLRQAHADLAVLVDDAERLTGPTMDVLTEICRLVDRDGGLLVAATTTVAASTSRGLVAAAGSDGTGLVLCPGGASDGAPLGVRLVGVDPPTPGRGFLVTAGTAVVVQVALTAAPGGSTPPPRGSADGEDDLAEDVAVGHLREALGGPVQRQHAVDDRLKAGLLDEHGEPLELGP